MSIQMVSAQTDSDKDIKYWKDKAKAYKKNPAALMADMENYQNQIAELKKQNKKLLNKMPEAKGTIDSLTWKIVQVEGELNNTKNELGEARTELDNNAQDCKKMVESYKSLKKVNNQGIKMGLIYRVQIGAYVFHEMEASSVESEDFVVEQSDGFNKYLIGSFRTFEDADQFREELQVLGISDGWVVPYIDGSRATIREAKQYLNQQGVFAE